MFFISFDSFVFATLLFYKVRFEFVLLLFIVCDGNVI